jgi:NADH:ubiquinone oxidoreductase subunit E
MSKINMVQKEKIHKILKYYPDNQSALLPILFYLQDENRYLDDMVLWELCKTLDIDFQFIKDVAEYYVMLRTQPVGEKLIRVCTNVACTLCGSEELVEYMEEKLRIKVGETSKDGKYSLFTAHCLACCNNGPAIQVNDKYYKHISRKDIDRLLETTDAK